MDSRDGGLTFSTARHREGEVAATDTTASPHPATPPALRTLVAPDAHSAHPTVRRSRRSDAWERAATPATIHVQPIILHGRRDRSKLAAHETALISRPSFQRQGRSSSNTAGRKLPSRVVTTHPVRFEGISWKIVDRLGSTPSGPGRPTIVRLKFRAVGSVGSASAAFLDVVARRHRSSTTVAERMLVDFGSTSRQPETHEHRGDGV